MRNPITPAGPGRRRFLAMAGAAAVAPWPARAQASRPHIVAFGDSLTAGFGLPPGQGLVPVLSDWLAERDTPARITDAGLSGDTSYGGRIRIGWALRRGADAVMVELGGNDMLLGWSAAAAEPNFDAILETAKAGGRPVLLIGISAPQGTREWRQDWFELWPRLADRHQVLLLRNLYAPFAGIPRSELENLLLADGIHPSAEGVRLIVNALGPSVQDLIAAI